MGTTSHCGDVKLHRYGPLVGTLKYFTLLALPTGYKCWEPSFSTDVKYLLFWGVLDSIVLYLRLVFLTCYLLILSSTREMYSSESLIRAHYAHCSLLLR